MDENNKQDIINKTIKPFMFYRYISSDISSTFDVFPDYQRYLFESGSKKSTNGVKAIIINADNREYEIISNNTIDLSKSILTHINWFVTKLYRVNSPKYLGEVNLP